MPKEIPTNLEEGVKKTNNEREKSEELLRPESSSNPIEQYTNQVERKNELQEQISGAAEQIEKDHADISQLRESMGLPADPNFKTESDRYISDIEKQKQGVEEKIREEERDLLDVPESEEKNPENMKTRTEALRSQEKEDFEGFEKVEKEAREKFVQEFIDSAIQKMLDDFKTFLDGSENADNARQLMQKKTTIEVQNKAKDFIENGGEPNFGFEAEIKGAEFDGPEGKKVKYITGFNITFEDRISITDKNAKNEGNLIDSQTQEEMQEAKKQGGLEEIKKEAA